ncbi:tail fiber protein [Dyadobacter sp. NIV53]|uniref:phage tail protein n=1 Tax=Dyadobacter sp. NIV53 TaxID=2861765 RepID=UPI001C87B6CD|nr:tail fiber protein [Dyadobacter sp. NIV53]
MAYPYVGEIRMYAGKSAPDGWLFCDGKLLPIADNHFLFRLLGTTYGGDGEITFGLPDLRKYLPIHQDEGPGSGVIINQLSQLQKIPAVSLQTPKRVIEILI